MNGARAGRSRAAPPARAEYLLCSLLHVWWLKWWSAAEGGLEPWGWGWLRYPRLEPYSGQHALCSTLGIHVRQQSACIWPCAGQRLARCALTAIAGACACGRSALGAV